FAACAMLLGAADTPETQIITRDGLKQMLANPGTDPVGARKPDVGIVEYYDYNCPYCKNLVPALQGVLAQDPKVAVVYKDWPILSAVSKYAAVSALLARNDQEAHALTLKGTPGIVVGRQLVFGIVDLGQLQQLVANSRQGKDK